MSRYIDADKLQETVYKRVNNPATRGWLNSLINEQPTADVKEVKHGEWLVTAFLSDSDDVVIIPFKEHQHDDPYCSICGKYALLNGGEEYVISNFCPSCGARMDGGVKE